MAAARMARLGHNPPMAAETATPAAHPDRARAGDLFAPSYRGLTVGLVATITLVAMESLAIGTVMPTVAQDLRDLSLYGWVYAAFFLGSMIGIVVSGGLLDRWPLHRPFSIGLGLFALGLVLGGGAGSMPMLVAARFVQGLGGGSVPPTAYVAVGRLLPERLQPRMFALMSAAWVVPGIVGPSIAALIGATVGWRWVFLGLVPFLALAGGLALTALRRIPAKEATASIGTATTAADAPARRSATLHRLGAALLAAAGAGCMLLALDQAAPLLIVAGVAAGLLLLVPAFRWLTPAGTLRLARGVPAAVLLRGIMTVAFFSGDAYIALLLQTWRHEPIALTGVVFTLTTVAWSAGTWIQARRIERLGPVFFIAAGFACIALGSLLTIPVVLDKVPAAWTAVSWTIPGIGMGLMYSAVTLVVLRGSDAATQGSASSALQLSDILGTALGTGVGGAFVAAGERAGEGGLGMALAAVFVLSTVVAVAGMVAARQAVVPRRRPGSTPGSGDPAAVD